MDRRFILSSGAAMLGLTACSTELGGSTFGAPAGQQLTDGFGRATAHNIAVQNAKLQREIYGITSSGDY